MNMLMISIIILLIGIILIAASLYLGKNTKEKISEAKRVTEEMNTAIKNNLTVIESLKAIDVKLNAATTTLLSEIEMKQEEVKSDVAGIGFTKRPRKTKSTTEEVAPV